MQVKDVLKEVGRWIAAVGCRTPGFRGAYLSGSILEMRDEDTWSGTSDVDVVIVIVAGENVPSPKKLLWNGLILEITYIPQSEYRSLEYILTTHYLAYALGKGRIVSDPEGWLASIADLVAEEWLKRRWVEKRIDRPIASIEEAIEKFNFNRPYPEVLNSWLFPTGITTFPILTAAGRNCTVKKRYPAARRVLEESGHLERYPEILCLLAGGRLDPACIDRHMAELRRSFACAAESSGASAKYRFREDIQPEMWNSVAAATERLAVPPYPEEALFWMGATFARCQIILEMDGSRYAPERARALRDFTKDLGLASEGDYRRRFSKVKQILPKIRKLAMDIAERE